MMREFAKPLGVLLSLCSLLYCHSFVSLLHASQNPLRKPGCSDPPISETASGRPFRGRFQARPPFKWDFDGRLVQALSTTQGTIDLAYDVDGIRVAKSVNGVLQKFVVDKNRDFAQVIEERDLGGSVQVAYVYGDDLVSGEFVAAGLGQRFYHYDGQRSTRQLNEASAGITDFYAFDAFGVSLASSGITQNTCLYAGEQFDVSLGSYYLRARYMDPASGTCQRY